MIDTLFFVLQIVGFVTLLSWAVLHDGQKEEVPTRGPLAYKQDEGAVASASRGQKRDRGLAKQPGREQQEG